MTTGCCWTGCAWFRSRNGCDSTHPPIGVDLGGVMRHPRAMPSRSAVQVPADLRARLETARLDLLALFRALDRMDLAPAEIPQRLIRQLFELDADCAEALWALDQPP